MKIKLFDPSIGKQEEKAILNVLKSKSWASGSGTGNVLKFEQNFNKYIDSKNCCSVNNGTSALQIAVSLFDVKNSEIIVPSLSFVSTANAALYNQAKPVFVDVDPKTLCIDPEKIRKSITKKTKIILPVHFGGMAANLNKILDICKEYNLILIEDAAHAAGSKYKGNFIGTHGSVVCFSFHPVKNLAMPTGGALTFNGKNNLKNYELSKIKRWCGISNRIDGKYNISELGFNAYLNEFSAAIGIIQLKKLDKMNKLRHKIAKQYFEKINIENKMPFDNNCAYHLYWIQVKNQNLFRKKLKENGIETGIHYLPIHKMKFFSDKKQLPITEEVSSHIVSLPIHPNLSNTDINKIIKLTNKFSN
jgi:perosamine synthetase